MAYITQLKQQK